MLYLSSKQRNKISGRYKINYDLCVSRLKTVIHSTVDSRLNFSYNRKFNFLIWSLDSHLRARLRNEIVIGRINMNFDRLTNISKELTVGWNQQPLRFYDRNCHKYGRLSQTVSSRLDYNSIFNDQKQLRNKPLQDCYGNSASRLDYNSISR